MGHNLSIHKKNDLVKGWESSGLSVRAYAILHGVPASSMERWIRLHRAQAGYPTVAQAHSAAQKTLVFQQLLTAKDQEIVALRRQIAALEALLAHKEIKTS